MQLRSRCLLSTINMESESCLYQIFLHKFRIKTFIAFHHNMNMTRPTQTYSSANEIYKITSRNGSQLKFAIQLQQSISMTWKKIEGRKINFKLFSAVNFSTYSCSSSTNHNSTASCRPKSSSVSLTFNREK